MIKKIQKYKRIIQGIFVPLGGIALFDWVIAPGLTEPNSIINMFSLLLGIVVILAIGIFFWENFLKNHKTDNKWEDIETNTNKEKEN